MAAQNLGSAGYSAGCAREPTCIDIAGIRALLVHAISPEAKRFCEQCGFSASSVHPMTLMITVADAERALGG
jgi:hypothetical protein